jgi:acyloxyacyl hydrolase
MKMNFVMIQNVWVLQFLGDSISAHFHIPEEWLDAQDFSIAAFEHLLFILEDELDWPEMSATTGHVNVSWPNIDGVTRSVYLRLFDVDHCNHRDYQNIAVNGARSGAMLEIMKSLARNPQSDVPLLVFYSLVGNDVCNGHPDTIAHMTTPEEMRANVLATLTYLDTVLPNGSHVVATGLANGSYLYDLLYDHMHPFGRVGTPLTYPQMYDYLSCLEISPCNGWLTSNGTLRDLTTQRAVDLSAAIKNATTSYQPRNFDTAYLDFPFDAVVDEWVAQGGQPWQLIEPVDGFHINQYGHAIVSDILWKWLQTEKPQWLPPLNPHNADIERVFKDQGGY